MEDIEVICEVHNMSRGKAGCYYDSLRGGAVYACIVIKLIRILVYGKVPIPIGV